jgi:vacuolar-type H+-ATPase subunit D/Vma8
MGCFKTIEVIAKDDLEKHLVTFVNKVLMPAMINDLKNKIIPDLINQLQYQETKLDEKLDTSSNKIEINF